MPMTTIEVLKGVTLVDVVRDSDEAIDFYTDDDRHFQMYHEQDCCEDVTIEDICGDLRDLVGSPVIVAEKVTYDGEDDLEDLRPSHGSEESYTWTFYKLATNKGSVTIRWFGSSNGYYSEEADFREITH